MLSNAFWQSHFGGRATAIGQKLTLNDVSYTVGGVLLPQFHLPSTRAGTEQRRSDIYVPYNPSDQPSELERTDARCRCSPASPPA